MTAIAILILISGLGVINFLLRQRTLIFKVVASIIFVIFFGGLYLLFIVMIWNSSDNPSELRSKDYTRYKRIHFINRSEELRNIYLKYVVYDSLREKNNEIKDSIQVHYGTSTNMQTLRIPIADNDKVNFLKHFSIEVKDSLNNTIEVFNEAEFLKHSTIVPENLTDKRAAEVWTLEIK